MKKILFFVFSVFMCLSVAAQTEVNKKLMQNLKNELSDISQKKIEIKDIAFNADGHWLIIFGDIGYSYSYLPTPIEDLLGKLNSEGTQINSSCLLSDTSWVLFYGDGKYSSVGLPQDIANELSRVKSKGKVCGLAAKGGASVVRYGNNGFAAKSAPSSMLKKLAEINKRHVKIRDIQFVGSGNGWILLYGDKGLAFQNLPEGLAECLKNHVKKGRKVNIVRSYGDYWIVVYDGYKVETNI